MLGGQNKTKHNFFDLHKSLVITLLHLCFVLLFVFMVFNSFR